MTLITAVIFGVATGLFITDKHRRLWITGMAVTLMLGIQSFVIPLFHKPSFSLSDPGYWATQPVILLFGLLISTGVAHQRRRSPRSDVVA